MSISFEIVPCRYSSCQIKYVMVLHNENISHPSAPNPLKCTHRLTQPPTMIMIWGGVQFTSQKMQDVASKCYLAIIFPSHIFVYLCRSKEIMYTEAPHKWHITLDSTQRLYIDVTLSTFVYRLFHEDFSSLVGTNLHNHFLALYILILINLVGILNG